MHLSIVTAIHPPPSPPTDIKRKKIGERSRLATCSDVAWFGDTCLYAVNVVGDSLDEYNFDGHEIIHVRRTAPLPQCRLPINVAVSPDGKLLAATSSYGGLYVYDRGDLSVPKQIFSVGDRLSHGVRFYDSRFVLYTVVEDPAFLVLCDLETGEVFQKIRNVHAPSVPKGISFSPAGDILAVVYSGNADQGDAPSFVVGYEMTPRIGRELWRNTFGLSCGEGVVFLDETHIAITDQDRDLIVIGDVKTSIGQVYTEGLSFPHGLALSPNGKFLTVANYGNNSLTCYVLT